MQSTLYRCSESSIQSLLHAKKFNRFFQLLIFIYSTRGAPNAQSHLEQAYTVLFGGQESAWLPNCIQQKNNVYYFWHTNT